MHTLISPFFLFGTQSPRTSVRSSSPLGVNRSLSNDFDNDKLVQSQPTHFQHRNLLLSAPHARKRRTILHRKESSCIPFSTVLLASETPPLENNTNDCLSSQESVNIIFDESSHQQPPKKKLRTSHSATFVFTQTPIVANFFTSSQPIQPKSLTMPPQPDMESIDEKRSRFGFVGDFPEHASIGSAELALRLETDLCRSQSEREVFIVDCRYPYEYIGGRIITAINVCGEPEQVVHQLVEQFFNEEALSRSKDVMIVFHCEYSANRAPYIIRIFKAIDCFLNHKKSTPEQRFYPKPFLLHHGYKNFYELFPNLCEPSKYVQMIADPLLMKKWKKICHPSKYLRFLLPTEDIIHKEESRKSQRKKKD